MHEVWEALKDMPEVQDFAWKLTIIQGAFMVRAGGGASASAGYHDQAGCLDVRTWNLTADELNRFIRASRKIAFPFWRRDYSYLHGGMDPHAHGTLGTDHPLTSGAQDSWSSYVHGGDGLAGSRPDYEWRPSPLVTTPPANLLKEDYFMTAEAQKSLNEANRRLTRIEEKLDRSNANQRERDEELLAAVNAAKKAQASKRDMVTRLGGLADRLGRIEDDIADDATKAQVRELKRQVLQALADDPDVDGADNPVT
jgi:hypothetical protein